MELKKFIKNSLVGIIDGINDADKEIEDRDIRRKAHFYINPSAKNNKEAKYISFDIAVTTSNAANAQAQGEGKIYIADLSLEGELKHATERTNRISFKVCCDHIG